MLKLFSTLLLSALLTFSGYSQESNTCDIYNSNNGTSELAVWLFSGPYTDAYSFDSPGVLMQNNDGTALFTGTVIGAETGNTLELAVYFENRSTWAEWSAMGRNYKDTPGLVDDNYLDYSFYELSSSSTITVNGGEDVLSLSHAPANFYYAFQMGIGANTYTAVPGLGGWFTYSSAVGSGQGDFIIEGNCPFVAPNYDCPNLSANIGDSCNDLDSNTENDVVGDDCICAGTLAEVLGCTDSASSNYNPAANMDDGSCLYLCDADPADLLMVSNNTGFDDGSGLSYGSNSGMGLLAGANNAFGGFIWNVSTTGFSADAICISIDYTVTGDQADFPRVLEFRLENNGTGNWNQFNMEVPSPGTYTFGGIVSDGAVNGSGFDPEGVAPSIVAAIAHFAAGPIVGDIDVAFTNLCVSTACGVDLEGCTDPASSNYNPAANIDDGSCLYLCDADPADLLMVSNNTGFDDGSGLSYGSNTGMGLLAGANNVFGGFIWDVSTTGLSADAICISIDYTVTGDAADFPKVLEFRLENNGTGNWNQFNMEVPGPGTYTFGGVVSSGTVNGSGFDPEGVAPSIVAAIAHFAAGPIVGDIDVAFSNLCVSTDCGADILGCTDPAANNYNQAATVDDGSCSYGGGCDVAIDFEATGAGAGFTWTVFENADNPPVNIVANPDMSGANTSATVAEITARMDGNPWAGAETMHGSDIGTFTLTPANSVIKLMVWKSTISDVGIKLVAADGGALGEIKVANTLTNQWEELTFDFSSQEAGMPGAVSPYDQIVIFPDFTFDPRPQDNVVYFDNFTFCPQGGIVDVLGCTDPAAQNYNQAATVDDGSCSYGGGCDVAIDFEATGAGAGFTWTVFENADNPPVNIVANPDMSGVNTSATVAEITARMDGNPWAGTETMHGSDIGTFTLTPANSVIKLMVWKSTISDVGIKLVAADGGALGEIKVANTLTNQWEELTFDFSSQEAGMPGAVSPYDQIVIFPDFTFDPRPQDNVVYFDNFTFCPQLLTIAGPPQAIVACDNGSTDPSETGMATASGICEAITIDYSDGLLVGNCPKTLMRTWTATDGCGASASCVQEILILEESIPEDCPSDITGDNIVDISDFLAFNSMYGSTCSDCPEDFNNDGVVDISDFLILNSAYGSDCTTQSAPFNGGTSSLQSQMMNDVRDSGVDNVKPELMKLMVEMSTSFEFAISPNPNDGNHFRLEMRGHFDESSSATLEIVDMMGRKVLSRSYSQFGKSTIVESDNQLSPGLYLISLTVQGAVITKRMVVE